MDKKNIGRNMCCALLTWLQFWYTRFSLHLNNALLDNFQLWYTYRSLRFEHMTLLFVCVDNGQVILTTLQCS